MSGTSEEKWGLPKWEKDFMENDCDGYIEWKIKQYEEKGYRFDDFEADTDSKTICYSEEGLEEEKKQATESNDKFPDYDLLLELAERDRDAYYQELVKYMRPRKKGFPKVRVDSFYDYDDVYWEAQITAFADNREWPMVVIVGKDGPVENLEIGGIYEGDFMATDHYDMQLYADEEAYYQAGKTVEFGTIVPEKTVPEYYEEAMYYSDEDDSIMVFAGTVKKVEEETDGGDYPNFYITIETKLLTFELWYFNAGPIEIRNVLYGQLCGFEGLLYNLEAEEQ